jgi:hypothetical protein
MAKVPPHVLLVADNLGQFAQSGAYVTVSEAEGLDGIAWGAHRIKQRRGDNCGFGDGHVEYRLKSDLDAWAAGDDSVGGGASAGGHDDPWKWRR